MSLSTFLNHVKSKHKTNFTEAISIIDESYFYTPTDFTNGQGDSQVENTAGTNEGSCKIFAFALLNQLSQQQTLSLFGDYYHLDVLNDPNGTSHQNIRQFMRHGWSGVQFKTKGALVLK